MKGTALSIFEIDAHKRSAPFQRGSELFYDDPPAPVFISEVQHAIAESEEKSLGRLHRATSRTQSLASHLAADEPAQNTNELQEVFSEQHLLYVYEPRCQRGQVRGVVKERVVVPIAHGRIVDVAAARAL